MEAMMVAACITVGFFVHSVVGLVKSARKDRRERLAKHAERRRLLDIADGIQVQDPKGGAYRSAPTALTALTDGQLLAHAHRKLDEFNVENIKANRLMQEASAALAVLDERERQAPPRKPLYGVVNALDGALSMISSVMKEGTMIYDHTTTEVETIVDGRDTTIVDQTGRVTVLQFGDAINIANSIKK